MAQSIFVLPNQVLPHFLLLSLYFGLQSVNTLLKHPLHLFVSLAQRVPLRRLLVRLLGLVQVLQFDGAVVVEDDVRVRSLADSLQVLDGDVYLL